MYSTSIGKHSRHYSNPVPSVNTVLSGIVRVLLNKQQINERSCFTLQSKPSFVRFSKQNVVYMAVRLCMDSLDPEGVGAKVLQNVSNYSLIGTASYGRKLDLTTVRTSKLACT